MTMDILFSAFSLASVFIYIYVGIYIIKQNKKSSINRYFLLLCISFTIWSFTYAFAYIAKDKEVYYFWNKTASIGWCSVSAISLYLVLLITENTIVKKKIIYILIFLPAVLFFYMEIFMFGANINTSPLVSNIFYIGDFLYNFIFLLISIILLFVWGLKSNKTRIKKQSQILTIATLIPFCLNLLTQTIIPLATGYQMPNVSQLYSVIMIIGVYRVITKYKFLRLPSELLFKEIEDRIMDMVIFLNENYEIVRVSKHTLCLLGFEEYEILNKSINYLFDKNIKAKIITCNINKEERKFNDVKILGKSSQKIPVDVTVIPVFSSELNDFLGVVLVMQDISTEYELRRINEQLYEKVIKDPLTKLYNHQYSVETIKKEISKINEGKSKKELSLMMLDIDYFKKVNDTYGHLFGDHVLEVVSDIMRTNVNDEGYVGRFGGEEFIIILPGTGINRACDIGEKIRSEIEKYNFNNELVVTISIGIKQFKNESSVELVKNADDLLYKAKQNGRNRIEYI